MSNRGQRPRIRAHSEAPAWRAVRRRTDYSSSTRILTDITDRTDHVVACAIRQKHQKPLAVDAGCLLRAIDAVPV